MLLVVNEFKVYTREGEDIVIEKKTAPAANKTEEKGGFSMGPMLTSGWKSRDYSAPAAETISLVGKSTSVREANLGGFVPQTAGLG